MPSVEWETLLFFAGLFVMIGALVKTGVIGQMAEAAARATGGGPAYSHHVDPLRLSLAQWRACLPLP
jgi:Na+/H+ antiporter NhaD/arsenite permease-like protein